MLTSKQHSIQAIQSLLAFDKPLVLVLNKADRFNAEEQAALMQQLLERIDAAGGWLDFVEYMQLALYAPGLGYYSAGARNFGAAGDFVTAPEITPAFGACIARGIAPLLQAGDSILELGAGSGALAAA